jgi:competence ComEA-like helix-hairpin-helix protein
MSRFVVVLLALSACTPDPGASEDAPILLDWRAGDTFQLAARTRLLQPKTPNTLLELSTDALQPPIGEAWTPESVWTYQVVEDDLLPAAGDELAPYATDALGEVRPIDVVKVSLDRDVQPDAQLAEADPVLYLVFRADRNRLAAVVSFVNVGGERVERAVSSHNLDASWGALSQSMLADAPTYLAPFAARFADESLVLENGAGLRTTLVDPDVVDATFADELGGGEVTSRYERGQPWPTETHAPNLEARLVDSSDPVFQRAAPGRAWADGPPPDFDYRAALAQSIDIDASLQLDAETQGGGWLSFVYDEFTPWPGSWWPLKSSAIVFGYDDRATLSDRVRATIDPLARRRDEINTALRGLSSSDPTYSALVTEYQTKTSEEVDALVAFYDDVRADLDGGTLRISGDQLVHDEGWSYKLDELSPFDKFGLAEHLRNADINNPFYLSAWELLNAYNPVGGSWWGKCNGWSASAILANEPKAPVTWTSPEGQALTFTTADQKGLLAASFYGTRSVFYGARYNGPTDDITDLTPKAFHHIVEFYLRKQRIPFVFDTDAGDAVWNFPVVGALLDVTETGGPAGGAVNINTASVDALDALPYISRTVATRIVEYRTYTRPFQTVDELVNVRGIGSSTLSRVRSLVSVAPSERTFQVTATVTFESDGVAETWTSDMGPTTFDETWSYTLVTDADGRVLRGTWATNEEHPDFAWVPYDNPRGRSDGSSENPFLEYGALLSVLGEDIERR